MLRDFTQRLSRHGKSKMQETNQDIKTDLKKLILSHKLILKLRKPRQEYIANQLCTVFCKGKKIRTALKEINQSCGQQSEAIAAKIFQDLALQHLTKIIRLPGNSDL